MEEMRPPHRESLRSTISGLLPPRWKTIEIDWVGLKQSYNPSRKHVGGSHASQVKSGKVGPVVFYSLPLYIYTLYILFYFIL